MRHRNKVIILIIVIVIAILVVIGFSVYSLVFNAGRDSEKKKEQERKNQIRENQIAQNQEIASQIYKDDVGKITNSIITNECPEITTKITDNLNSNLKSICNLAPSSISKDNILKGGIAKAVCSFLNINNLDLQRY